MVACCVFQSNVLRRRRSEKLCLGPIVLNLRGKNEPNGASRIKVYGPQQGNSLWSNDRCIDCGYRDIIPSPATTIITEDATNSER